MAFKDKNLGYIISMCKQFTHSVSISEAKRPAKGKVWRPLNWALSITNSLKKALLWRETTVVNLDMYLPLKNCLKST